MTKELVLVVPCEACQDYGMPPCGDYATTVDILAAVRTLDGVEEVWLCREDERMQDWAEGTPPHCWFRGVASHHPGCGWHLVVPISEEGDE